jgi:hypothetical protein
MHEENGMTDDDDIGFGLAVVKTEGGSTDVEMTRLILDMFLDGRGGGETAAAVHELIWSRLPSDLQTEAFRDRIMGPYHY